MVSEGLFNWRRRPDPMRDGDTGYDAVRGRDRGRGLVRNSSIALRILSRTTYVPWKCE